MRPLRVWLKAGHTVEIIRRLVPEFTDRTGVRVEIAVVAEGAAHDGLITAAEHPDVVTAPFWYLDELTARGILAPLSLSALGLDDRFVPLALDALSRDGHVYAVPHTLTGGMLSYRADLFAALGIEPPSTLDETIAAHAALRHAGHAGLVARANPEFSSLETFAGWAAARGRTILPGRGPAAREDLVAGAGDLIAALRSHGAGLADLDYAAVGELIVEERATMLFDTSAWVFRFEASDSPVRGRMGYTVIGAEAPAQFMYAEGLAVTTRCDLPEAAQQFLRWRHSERVLREEVEQIGRIDVPRLDLRELPWFSDYVDVRGLAECLAAIDRSWAAGSTAHVARRPDYVEAARQTMALISGVIGGTFTSIDEAVAALSAPTGPRA
ncbi:ABC transporter substrate-binding protein [Agromyces aerolatus]|uniref:ABC transporter substrate-binding protein n=1 Tax=Agromyces sp. LY-1074 TaxID=3074080 RepID=UPI0028597E80|nr:MULTISPECIES: extracellular solute-binding protein [unclassified Agromyces]MDR5699549.1 extracellular solute-binding protein [Agromyces sp. LY-1074]MDR5705845.1 extracellular solute-binding protein [Agromyces sp. LY-1358]